MRDQETNDIITALAIGAVIGVGAALLMRGSEPSRREKLVRELKPYTKRAHRGLRAARAATREHIERGVDAGTEFASDLRGSTGDLVSDLRGELSALVEAAGEELRRTARRTVRETRRSIRNLR